MSTNHKPMMNELATHDAFTSSSTDFEGAAKSYIYLPSVESQADIETVLVFTTTGDLYVTSNQGEKWHLVDAISNAQETVKAVFVSENEHSEVVVYTERSTSENTAWISLDRAVSFRKIQLPASIQGYNAHTIKFHPKNSQLVIFQGYENCENSFDCIANLYLSRNGGADWQRIQENVFDCDFADLYESSPDYLFCVGGNNQLDPTKERLFYTEDYFATGPKYANGLNSVQKVAEIGKYLMAVELSFEGPEVLPKLHVSRDGKTFQDVNFPNVNLDMGQGVTTIATDSDAIMLYIATKNSGDSSNGGEDFGVLLRSNERGTDFSIVLKNLNRAPAFTSGFVDFDHLKSIEGVSIANIVANPGEVANQGAEKRVKSVITHSDGAFWDSLPAPEGMCDGQTDCSLHLHGYIDRLNYKNQPSSPYAVGMFIGRGNVGDSLQEFRTSQTFMTTDAGISWKKIHDRPVFWVYLDSGSVIVLADAVGPTDSITYSVDGGKTFVEKKIFDKQVDIINLATMPTSTSTRLIVFAQLPLSEGDKSVALELDFATSLPKRCKSNDFELWLPEHPRLNSACLLGHSAQYERKKPNKNCRVGKKFFPNDNTELVNKPKVVLRNCKCTRQDFECDYGYELNEHDGVCVKIAGVEPLTMEQQCANGGLSWVVSSGYRKVARSTCEGGEQLENTDRQPCPGHEDDYNSEKPGNGNNNNGNGGENDRDGYYDDINLHPSGSKLMVFLFLVFLLLVMTALIHRKYSTFNSIQLGLGEEGGSLVNRFASFGYEAFSRTAEFFASLPLMWSRTPHDRMGFYSRMNDDERYRILDEADGFFDSDISEEDAVEHGDAVPGPSESIANEDEDLSIDPTGSTEEVWHDSDSAK